MAYRTLDDLNVKGKRVLVRADLNVPMKEGRVTDATRIERQAPTIRELADTNSIGHLHRKSEIDSTKDRIDALSNIATSGKNVGDTKSSGFSSCFEGQRQGESWRASIGSAQWWEVEPDVGRVANGVDARVDRLKAIGNGQVPLCAATAWRILNEL